MFFNFMMMGRQALLRSLRRLHRIREQDPVEDECRGWNWDRPPVRPRAYLGLGVSEIAYKYCATKRDVYLRRLGVSGERTQQLFDGGLVHAVFHAASSDVRRELTLGFKGWEAYERLASASLERLRGLGVQLEQQAWLLDLYKQLVLTWCAEEFPWLFTEYRVDGSFLGLSRNLRVDGLAEGGVVFEVKYGKLLEFHALALAGYALALESSLEVPFDYGVLVYVVNNGRVAVSWEPVYISTRLRAEFIEQRDELNDILLSGREPLKAENCPDSCPYRGVCG
ncbi:MAG: type I-A CRISPR-associated protein Cas4/Csa1 [Thermofilaceae archaeon]